MAETITIRYCEDLSWTGKPLTCCHLKQARQIAKCNSMIVEGESYEVHLAIPDNRSVLYIDGIHNFANTDAVLI